MLLNTGILVWLVQGQTKYRKEVLERVVAAISQEENGSSGGTICRGS